MTGLRAWLVQRISAIYMLCFIVFMLFHFLLDPPRSYPHWHGWVARPAIGVAAAIFFAALLLHTWVGIRDVVMDYVHPIAARLGVLVLLGLGLLALALWVMRILLLVHGQ